MSDQPRTPAVPSTPERVTVSLTPRGRQAMDRLVAERGRNRSDVADDSVILLALVHAETATVDGSCLAILRPDGTAERIHVP